jgi:hypothetical protein
MLAPLERKNCWTIAEHLGDLSSDGLQHLLARASWMPRPSVTTCADT